MHLPDLSFGLYQRSQATEFAFELAATRGHLAEDLTVRPSFANIVLWRIVYRHGDHYFIDAVRTLPLLSSVHYPGSKAPVYSPQTATDALPAGAVLAVDVERFRFFSQGDLHRHPTLPDVIGDTRYAMFPDSTVPLWGIRINSADPTAHVAFEYFRDASPSAFDRLWRMISGKPVDPVL